MLHTEIVIVQLDGFQLCLEVSSFAFGFLEFLLQGLVIFLASFHISKKAKTPRIYLVYRTSTHKWISGAVGMNSLLLMTTWRMFSRCLQNYSHPSDTYDRARTRPSLVYMERCCLCGHVIKHWSIINKTPCNDILYTYLRIKYFDERNYSRINRPEYQYYHHQIPSPYPNQFKWWFKFIIACEVNAWIIAAHISLQRGYLNIPYSSIRYVSKCRCCMGTCGHNVTSD